ncbi:hypothetical protein [Marinimicrococcus flavescens]|uniref:Lytic transglycosylase domain-containing protein n=1 Tax=Marinimicrococcus flavescens TaxID=3031815 RepID=A0AAP3XQU4_9PROT|nr:hypothetical protein [Marinimicrococcus flavescens]
MLRLSSLLLAGGLGLLLSAGPAATQSVRQVLQAPTAATTVDEGPMWAALAAGDLRLFEELELRARRKSPGWQPSAALARERRERELRSEVGEARSAGDPAALARLSTTEPGLFGCADPDNLWALAAAHRRTGDEAKEWEVHERAVRECPFEIRLTTLQKAQGRYDAAQVRKLLDLPGNRSPGEEALRREIDGILSQRAYGANVRSLAALVDKAGPGTTAPAWLAGLERQIAGRRDGRAALLLGWWHQKGGAPAEALRWFDQAAAWGASADANKGLVAAYLAGGDPAKAAEIVRRDPSAASDPEEVLGAARAAMVHRLLEAEDFSACLEAVADPLLAERSDMAAARGWCLLGTDEPRASLAAFEVAERLAEDDASLQGDARKGQVAAIRALGDPHELERLLVLPWIDRPLRQELEIELARRSFLTRAEARQWGSANEAAMELERRGVPLGGAKDVLWAGWVAMRAGDCWTAMARFDRLKNDADTEIARDAWRGWWDASRSMSGDGCS